VGAGGSFSSTDLVVLWAGANDFLREGVTNPGIPVANISTSIQALAGAGATTILIPNLPDLSNTPAITSLGDPTTSGGMQALTLGFNGLLEGELASLRASLGIDLVRLDVFTLANEVTANPAAFGFANATEGAYLVGEIANANDYTYWDGIHPTESMHRLFAQRGARALGVPEPSTAVFAALGALGIALRRRR
jgi:phospholipase/lecithinase/hemolysin